MTHEPQSDAGGFAALVPDAIVITIPARSWRVLGLGTWKQSGKSVWQPETRRGGQQYEIWLDVDTARYLRECGKIASASKRDLNNRDRNAAWIVVARVTTALQKWGIER